MASGNHTNDINNVNQNISKMQAEVKELQSLLSGEENTADSANTTELTAADLQELLRRLETADGISQGVENRLDDILSDLDDLISSLDEHEANAQDNTEPSTERNGSLSQ
jgi:glutaredoxin 2